MGDSDRPRRSEGRLERVPPGPLLHPHAHGHGHSHEHGHGHSHEHAFPPPEPSPNAPLVAGDGRGKVLLLDTPSGIAGDMTVAALVDLGVPFEVVESAVAAIAIDGYRLERRPARNGAIGGTRYVVELMAPQPERAYAAIVNLLERAALAPAVKELAQRIFRRLAEAESAVHRVPLTDVTFHEVGAVDAIADIVGAAACFVHLDAHVVGTAVPLGRGLVECQHGLLPLPAPATLLCLRGVPTYDSGLPFELVTPTGAAILATVVSEFTGWPSFAPERVGWGCGTRVIPNRTNALRAVLGSEVPSREATRTATHAVLEANVDDMTGELVGHAIESLLRAGALDAWAAPVTMKKGRPGLVIACLVDAALERELSEQMLRETTSIGVRSTPVSRTERPRRIVEVATEFGPIPVKVSEGAFGPALAKPEFDACAAAARAADVPVRDVLAAALAAYARSNRA